MLPKEKAAELFTRFLNDGCTEEETALLMREFAAGDNRDLLRALVRARLEDASGEDAHAAAIEAVYARIEHRIGQAPARKKPRLLWSGLAAAASLLLLLGAGWWLSKKGGLPPVIAQEQQVTDFVPGGEKALLTLADGSTITLDSAGNGTLASQGGTSVTKPNNGQLVYAPAGTPGEMVFNNIATPKGGTFQVTLSDGTRAWLNAASSLRFPTVFTGSRREVEVKGEVYFEVTHNASAPFIVKSGNAVVKVLGTHFNVNAYQDEAEMKITLLTGSVAVSAMANGAPRLLRPGQQAAVVPGEEAVTVRNETNLEGIMAWKDNLFYFDNADIKAIMRQLGRWYNIEVAYEGAVPQRQFSGKISRNTNASNVIRILEQSDIHFRMENGKIVVIP